jgi:hypothetical protein
VFRESLETCNHNTSQGAHYFYPGHQKMKQLKHEDQ